METENKIYTAADFAKYYKGNMTFAEMHALEKAALDNPFLADALEGYAATQTGEKDVEIIKQRLSAYNRTKKNPLFVTTNKIWVRIAAILVITLGISYFFYNKKEDKEIILAENKISTEDTVQTAVANTDTFKAEAEKKVTTNTTKEEVPVNINETAASNNDKVVVSNPVSSSKLKDEAVERNDDKRNLTYNKIDVNNKQNILKFYTQQGNVTDLLGSPLEGVTVKDKNSNKGTITDYDGKFKLKTTDSNAYVSIGSIGYESKEVKLYNNQLQNITLDKKNSNLEEVVVMGLGSSRKKSQIVGATTSVSSNELSGKVAGINVQTQNKAHRSKKTKDDKFPNLKEDTVINSTGVFNEYVKNNKIPLFDENNKPLKGQVVLSFYADKYGKPQNIKITSTTCQACNNQAINLLNIGPTWIFKQLKTQVIVIEF